MKEKKLIKSTNIKYAIGDRNKASQNLIVIKVDVNSRTEIESKSGASDPKAILFANNINTPIMKPVTNPYGEYLHKFRRFNKLCRSFPGLLFIR